VDKGQYPVYVALPGLPGVKSPVQIIRCSFIYNFCKNRVFSAKMLRKVYDMENKDHRDKIIQ